MLQSRVSPRSHSCAQFCLVSTCASPACGIEQKKPGSPGVTGMRRRFLLMRAWQPPGLRLFVPDATLFALRGYALEPGRGLEVGLRR